MSNEERFSKPASVAEATPPRDDAENAESEAKLAEDSPLLRSDLKHWWVEEVMGPLESQLIRWGATPNGVTLLAFFLCFPTFWLFATGHILSAGWMVLLIGSLDILDGRIARRTSQTSVVGEFLDSVMDRFQDFLLLSGLCVHYHGNDALFLLILTLAALGGSLLVSYVRAKAQALHVDLSKVGFMQRPERFFLLGFGSIVSSALQVSLMPFYGYGHRPPQHILIGVLLLLAVSTNWTAYVRIRHTVRKLREREVESSGENPGAV